MSRTSWLARRLSPGSTPCPWPPVPPEAPTLATAARRRCNLQLALGALGALVPARWALAQSGASVPATPASALEAGQWLQRIQHAAENRSYLGTMVVSAGGMVSSAKVSHVCDGRQRHERIEVLDGRPRTQYRHNDQLLTLWPARKVALMEQREAIADFPGLPAAAGQRAVDSYELRHLGTDRVAGHDADVLLLKPRDALRYAQRWWAERESGLLLRAEMLGARGELLESSTFTEVQLGGRLPPAENVQQALRRIDGWRILKPQVQRVSLDAEGWALARPVPGFHLVACSRRTLDPAGDETHAEPVLQSVFSDGLTHVSLFIEPYDAARHKQAMRTNLGATATVMSRHGDAWVTVVGDVPLAAALQFDAALEKRH